MITGIPSRDATTVWPLAEPILRRATERTCGRFTAADALERIARADMQLWLGGNPVSSVAVTEVLQYPRLSECRIVFAAGELGLLKAGMPMLEMWAQAQGCRIFSIEGRKGWERVFPGFIPEAVILRKDLT